MRRVRKILYNLGFAALLGLSSIPSMLAIHLLAQDTSSALWLGKPFSAKEAKASLDHYSLYFSEHCSFHQLLINAAD